jgi:dTMP kinase
MYIVFEGPWGSGKSTQAKKLAEYLKEKFPYRKVVTTREPGGTEIAETIRKVVQGTKFEEEMEPIVDIYLYAAARAQSLRKIVLPALEKNYFVVADRSFISSLAINGYAHGFGIQEVLEINKHAVKGCIPDLIIYLDVALKSSKKRTFDSDGDKFENAGVRLLQKAILGYKEIRNHKLFKKKWVKIKASGTIDQVHNRILKEIKPFLAKQNKRKSERRSKI